MSDHGVTQILRALDVNVDPYVTAAAQSRARDIFTGEPPPALKPLPKHNKIQRVMPKDYSKSEPEVVAGLFGPKEFLRVNGAPGAGKTTIAVDLGVHISAMPSWRGRKVLNGAVLFIEFEGELNVRTRIEATCKNLGLRLEDLSIYAFYETLSLADRPAWLELLASILELMQEADLQFRLIVIDTQARATAGLDENSASDAAVAIRMIDEIRAATGAAVLLLHHLPHGGVRGRGSSAWLGAVDAEFILSRDAGGFGTIKCEKMRNRESPKPIHYRLKSEPIGFGPDGEIITGACAVPAETPAPEAKLSDYAEKVLKIVGDHERGILKADARKLFLASYPHDPDSGRTAFARSLAKLVNSGHVLNDGEKLQSVSNLDLSDSLDDLLEDNGRAIH